MEMNRPEKCEATSSRVEPFDRHARKYELWFSRNKHAYLAELRTLRTLVKDPGIGLEIGIGSGRFAKPLGLSIGIEPSREMRRIAHIRGLDVVNGVAEALPIASGILDTALMVTTICFVDDIEVSLREAYRVLAPTGRLVIGFIDRASFLGRAYEERKSRNAFYLVANFYSTDELLRLLKFVGFSKFDVRQTIFHDLRRMSNTEAIKEGYGEGAFVALAASKTNVYSVSSGRNGYGRVVEDREGRRSHRRKSRP
jgi:SAM-dependent methyltransferase